MTLLDRRTISVLVTILAFAGVLALVWLARLPLIAFTFAVFFGEFFGTSCRTVPIVVAPLSG